MKQTYFPIQKTKLRKNHTENTKYKNSKIHTHKKKKPKIKRKRKWKITKKNIKNQLK